ncbi:DUF58 domain-containing protein [Halobaculum limi]|uniref:DUF58 domain-containing protein n=1 Tax=Halobaculum limi TaxID=3031916 RepID=UPI002407363C|nr:DUF58 domain-containing protein [Halobaculum sp. YSMS11]
MTTGRWTGAGALGLVAAGLGVVSSQPALLVAATIPLGLAAVARAQSPPEPSLAVSRSISDRTPAVDDRVEVQVTVRNEGATLRSLRLTDRVPRGLTVVDGSPERVTPLRPGAVARIEYTVAAARGRHEFGPVDAVVGAAPGDAEATTTLDGDPVAVECIPPLPTDPLAPRMAFSRLVGATPTRSEDDGTAFSSVREYRHGDPVSRIDWRGWARRGEPATVLYQAERTAAVTVVVDARRTAARVVDTDDPPATERCIACARVVAGGLLADGHTVGVAALGDDLVVPPSAGPGHRVRLERTLALDPALNRRSMTEDSDEGSGSDATAGDDAGASEDDAITRLRRVLPNEGRIVVCSPVADDAVVDAVRRLAAEGAAPAVVSPAVPTGDRPTDRFASAVRASRLRTLRQESVPVVDVPVDRSPAAALAGWSP